MQNKRLGKIIQSIILIISLVFMGSVSYRANSAHKVLFIYLIRHGQTYSNEQGLLVGGGGNYDLTEKGIRDAIDVGTSLSEVPFRAVYCSTLGRTYDTAKYILYGAGQEDLDIVQMEGLKDISWGDAEGYTVEGFMKEQQLTEFPDAFGSADDANFISPINAETKYDFCNRFQKTLLQIAKDNEEAGGNILVVAHSSMTFWLQQQFPDKVKGDLDNTSITILRYQNGVWKLLVYNDVGLER